MLAHLVRRSSPFLGLGTLGNYLVQLSEKGVLFGVRLVHMGPTASQVSKRDSEGGAWQVKAVRSLPLTKQCGKDTMQAANSRFRMRAWLPFLLR